MAKFTMSQTQYEVLLEACRPTPLIMLQCGPRPSLQEMANDAWERLGKEMGFKHMTVRPCGSNPLEFTAEPIAQPPAEPSRATETTLGS